MVWLTPKTHASPISATLLNLVSLGQAVMSLGWYNFWLS